MEKFLVLKASRTSSDDSKVPGPSAVDTSGSSDSDSEDVDESLELENRVTIKKRKRIIRRYDDKFLSYGFVCRVVSGEPRPQCVVCSTVLSNASLFPAKLQRHLQRVHPGLVGKPVEYFKRQRDGLSKQKGCMGQATKFNEKALRASYLLAVRIARSKKPHSIGESLVLPAAMEMCREMCGDAVADKLKAIPVSNDTVHRRIAHASQDVKEQLVSRILESSKFAIQLDESTDVAGQAQLMAYVRYVTENSIDEDFLFCEALPTTTTGEEIFGIVNRFIVSNGIDWKFCYGVCTDGAAGMTGKNAGVWARIRAVAPNAKFTH